MRDQRDLKIQLLQGRIDSLIVEGVSLSRQLKKLQADHAALRAQAEEAVRALDAVLISHHVEFGEYTVERLGEFAAKVWELVEAEERYINKGSADAAMDVDEALANAKAAIEGRGEV